MWGKLGKNVGETPRVFTASRVPEAEGFDGSSQMHAIYGRSVAPEAAKIDGPLIVRGVFCSCDPCEAFDFSPRACQMHAEFGHFQLEYAKRAVPRDPRITRSQELEAFALTLKKGQVHALAAIQADRHIEGNVWLCKLLSDAYVAPSDIIDSTDGIEAGWWVVMACYYRMVQRSPRGYQLETRKLSGREEMVERVLVVNHLIRLPAPGVSFAPPQAARKTPRLAAAAFSGTASRFENPLCILYDKEYYQIEGSMQAVH